MGRCRGELDARIVRAEAAAQDRLLSVGTDRKRDRNLNRAGGGPQEGTTHRNITIVAHAAVEDDITRACLFCQAQFARLPVTSSRSE